MRVVAEMLDGRVATYDATLPLDGLLAWAWIRRHHPECLERAPSAAEDLIEPDLPLERREAHGTWWWAASFAVAEPLKEQVVYYNRRFDAGLAIDYVDFGGRRGRINTTAGRYKAYRMPLPVLLIPRIEWYAVGDIEAVRDLLADITHIGKKTSQGFGAVREWRVETWAEDLSWLRPVPDPDGDDWHTIRPPYWHPASRTRVRWPDDGRLAARAVLAARP